MLTIVVFTYCSLGCCRRFTAFRKESMYDWYTTVVFSAGGNIFSSLLFHVALFLSGIHTIWTEIYGPVVYKYQYVTC